MSQKRDQNQFRMRWPEWLLPAFFLPSWLMSLGFHMVLFVVVALMFQRAGVGEGLVPIHLGTLRTLERGLDFSPDRLARIALGGVALAEARRLVGRFLRFHVGIDLRSARFLERMLPDLPVAGSTSPPPIDTAGS